MCHLCVRRSQLDGVRDWESVWDGEINEKVIDVEGTNNVWAVSGLVDNNASI